MTTIRATKIDHAICEETGKEIATFICRYPRWIHAEGRTHRQLRISEGEFEYRTPSLMEDENLSRNASSSRAVPVPKLIEDVLNDTAMPMHWGKHQAGMQAEHENDAPVWVEYDSQRVRMSREDAWNWGRDMMIALAKGFIEAGYHKQMVNRLLEPFSHINVVVTATEWSNFFGLRRHADAEPHIHLLADAIYTEMNRSKPRIIHVGDWYLPFVHGHERDAFTLEECIRLSVSRCASISYKTVDGLDMTPERAIQLFTKLIGSQPIHASPTEHQAYADKAIGVDRNEEVIWQAPNLHGNLLGFCQYRKTIDGECIE